MDKFTSFLKKRKAFVIVALIGIIAGFSLYNNPTPEEINKLKVEKSTILAKVDSSQEELSNLNKDIGNLQDEINKLNNEKQKQEELLKDTTDKIEKKKEEEAEKQRQAKIEKQEKANIVSQKESESNKQSSQNNSNENSDSNNINNSNSPHSSNSNSHQSSKPVGDMVYITATGKKYHRINNCGKTNPARTSYISLSEAQSMGYSPCSKCY
ncbi:hypothetical protein JJB46_07130 [Clostridium perfringens]|uniref:hypothetical protein n=1 Tax=Clostridium perfringens TaxID=1502 RepID=UPI001ABB45A1|nr:hypothetical protein [Clostridium perfringens]MBO3388033.1 hypothetical protein [Clostridium perfringens]MBO3413490.1 hypothetical protein [Clostridium perfringens]